jgi:hypothetical protein
LQGNASTLSSRWQACQASEAGRDSQTKLCKPTSVCVSWPCPAVALSEMGDEYFFILSFSYFRKFFFSFYLILQFHPEIFFYLKVNVVLYFKSTLTAVCLAGYLQNLLGFSAVIIYPMVWQIFKSTTNFPTYQNLKIKGKLLARQKARGSQMSQTKPRCFIPFYSKPDKLQVKPSVCFCLPTFQQKVINYVLLHDPSVLQISCL